MLTVNGFSEVYEPSTISLAKFASGYVYKLDLDDFIPFGVDPDDVPDPWLQLRTSAHLTARAEISIGSVAHGTASAPLVYGHLEGTGATVVMYREAALEGTYYGGDLDAWRRGGTAPPAGSGRVFSAYLEAE